MPKLTDKQIVRRIAKFMFARDEPVRLDVCNRWCFKSDMTPLPDWLTSYDALAPVWRKMYESDICMQHDAERGRVFRDWFLESPRDLAEAIAIALGGDE